MNLLRRIVYVDHAATTPTRPEVVRVMRRFFGASFGNPSSSHRLGQATRGAVELARERVARALRCHPEEVVFTGSGTEANNLALQGSVKAGEHVLVSPIAHSSVRSTAAALRERGVAVDELPVGADGVIDPETVAALLRPNTRLVSIDWVNNEIGAVQKVDRIAEHCRRRGVLLHLDAVQAFPMLDVDLGALSADLLSISGHKIHGPKGVGALFVRSGTSLDPLVRGGGQELGLRSGTENVPAIVGLAEAVARWQEERRALVPSLVVLRDRLIAGVLRGIPDARLTGPSMIRAPHIASFVIPGVHGGFVIRELSARGICAASGSACSSAAPKPSHVLLACQVAPELARGAIRFSLGRGSRMRDVERTVAALPAAVDAARRAGSEGVAAPKLVRREALMARLRSGEAPQIVDVRYLAVPRLGLPETVHAPLWALPKRAARLDRKRPTVIVCDNGLTLAADANAILHRLGFSHIEVLQGGAHHLRALIGQEG